MVMLLFNPFNPEEMRCSPLDCGSSIRWKGIPISLGNWLDLIFFPGSIWTWYSYSSGTVDAVPQWPEQIDTIGRPLPVQGVPTMSCKIQNISQTIWILIKSNKTYEIEVIPSLFYSTLFHYFINVIFIINSISVN